MELERRRKRQKKYKRLESHHVQRTNTTHSYFPFVLDMNFEGFWFKLTLQNAEVVLTQTGEEIFLRVFTSIMI